MTPVSQKQSFGSSQKLYLYDFFVKETESIVHELFSKTSVSCPGKEMLKRL